MLLLVIYCIVFCLLEKAAGVQVRVDLATREYAFSGVDSDDSNDSGYFFGILADPQLGMFQTYEKSDSYRAKFNVEPGNDGSDFKLELKTVEHVLENLSKLVIKPAFIIVLGDLVNQVPFGAVKKNLKGQTAQNSNEINQLQYSALEKTFKNCKIPIFVLPGNHDLGDSFKKQSLQIYKKQWGADYFEFIIGKTGYLVLNTQHWKNTVETMKNEGEQQFDWVETVFDKWGSEKESQRRARSTDIKRLVVFTHIPFWKFNKNEAVQKGSSLERETLGHSVTDRFVGLVEKHLNGVEMKIFSGHVHRDIVSMKGLQVIQNALSQNLVEKENGVGFEWRFLETGGYRLAKVTDQGLETEYYKFDENGNNFQIEFHRIGFGTGFASFWRFVFLTVMGVVLIYLIKTKLKKTDSKRF